jgi:hypothetical protein
MFILRKEHEDALLELARETFDEGLVPALREAYREQTRLKEDQEIAAEVRAAREQAEGYGMQIGAALREFVFLRVAFGPAMFEHPLFDEYMRRGHYTPELRFRAFLDGFIREGERLIEAERSESGARRR